jgi:hypothetical protein
MDFYFRGKACLNRAHDPIELARALTLFFEALRIDADNVDALVWAAYIDALLGCTNFGERGPARFVTAERNAANALLLAASCTEFLDAA